MRKRSLQRSKRPQVVAWALPIPWRAAVVATLLALSSASVSAAANPTGDRGGAPPSREAETTYVLVSSFQCFIPNCEFGASVLRYDAETGAYLGVHVADIPGAYGMTLHPVRGTLLVVSRTDSLINEYHARTGAFIRTLVTAGPEGLHSPQNVVFKPDGNLLVTSTQTAGEFEKLNGILEFDGTTGAFVRTFVDGGYILDEDPSACGDPRCIHDPNGMIFGPNGHLYVASNNNHLVLEYDLDGNFVGPAFDAGILRSPSGLVVRPPGTPNEGNILVTSMYRDPGDPTDFDKVLEFDAETHELMTPGNGIYAEGFVNPGPLMWRDNGDLLLGNRLFWSIAPNFSDRIQIREQESGAFLGFFTSPDDTHLHWSTAIFQVGFGFATGDYTGDGDVDLEDFAAFQNCYGPAPSQECLDAFNDGTRDETINRTDYIAFASLLYGPAVPCSGGAECDDGNLCTDDACEGGICTHTNNTTACDDGLFCTPVDTCAGGFCVGVDDRCPAQMCDEAGEQCVECLVEADCDDGNPCMTDSCDVSGVCQHVSNSDPCDDENCCTTNDICSEGMCVGGPALECEDEEPCTDDSCHPELCCLHAFNTSPCEDGAWCSLEDYCLLGVCRAGQPQDCDDGVGCTGDFCDELANSCVNAPNNADCDNSLWCDGAETCDPVDGCQLGSDPCPEQSCDEGSDECVP